MTKQCRKCLLRNHISYFSKDKNYKDGYKTICKCCLSVNKRRWYDATKEERNRLQREYLNSETKKRKAIERSKKWAEDNPDGRYDIILKQRLGINITDYKLMLDSQNNKCAICFKDRTMFKKRLAVDHCHKTGKIRGLLCSSCNTSIGLLEESIDRLNSAIKYLSRNKDE